MQVKKYPDHAFRCTSCAEKKKDMHGQLVHNLEVG